MKLRFTYALVTTVMFSALWVMGCGYRGPKGEVDSAMVNAGRTVTLSGTVGTVTVPMSAPVPDVSADELKDGLADAVSLTVKNDITGVTVNITEGILLDEGSTPASTGEWVWTVDATRELVTITFFNDSSEGALVAGGDYSAAMTIGVNDYIVEMPAIGFQITVQ